MEELAPLLIFLGILCFLSGPAALIVGLVALSQIGQLRRERALRPSGSVRREPVRTAPAAAPGRPVVQEEAKPVAAGPARPPVKATIETTRQPVGADRRDVSSGEALSLEQRIGTQWVLIAGVVTVIFAVGFFLKYAHDNDWIGPTTRVVIAGIAGLLALAIGEVTRRRGYGIVAKGVTALGFAILYATVFAAHRWYGLIDSVPAFALAIAVTVAAMLYAVALDEVVAAVLALVGGYITPVVVSTGQNLPHPLFSYVLILSAGAVLCAYWRRWPAVNILAFVGTYALYTGWFEKFYRPAMRAAGSPDQLGVALFWVSVFFLVYLALPILHGLIRRAMSETSDVVLLLANAAIVFYYLWTLLSGDHRMSLALCSLGLGAAHLALMVVVAVRCGKDASLRQTLLAIGLIFVTVAVPLYLKMYAIAATWAVEGVILTVIGLRYRSMLAEVAGVLVFCLAFGDLLQQLPMHRASFRVVFNPAFGTWFLVSAAMIVCCALYRLDQHVSRQWRSFVVEPTYAAGLLLLMAAVSLELWHHGELNVGDDLIFAKYIPLVFPGFLLLFVARPICPRGQLSSGLAMVIAMLGSLCTAIAFSYVHKSAYVIFLNGGFLRAAVLVAAMLAATWLLGLAESKGETSFVSPLFLAVMAILLLWTLLTQEIWYFWRCQDRYRTMTADWRFLAHMCISIMWAVYATVLMAVGFWRRVKLLRYIALAGFVLLLGKIFIVDTRNVSSLYRIVGFLATGVALVGVSYLYQYLKKQGFFEKMLADEGAGVR